MLSAGLISHNSIQLLTVTTDFVALSQFSGYVVFICGLLLRVLCLETKTFAQF